MTAHLLLFAATELLLSATPGPAVLLVVSQGIRRGYRSSTRAAARERGAIRQTASA